MLSREALMVVGQLCFRRKSHVSPPRTGHMGPVTSFAIVRRRVRVLAERARGAASGFEYTRL